MMQYNLIAANANAKSTSTNVNNVQLSDYRTSNNALSQASQQQPLQVQRSSLKQASQQAQEGGSGNFGSVMNRKQILQYSTNQQPANAKNLVQPTNADGASKDLSGGANLANHVQSAD